VRPDVDERDRGDLHGPGRDQVHVSAGEARR
jgi:hypothetical protein